MTESGVGMKEYELEAYFDFNCKVKGATGLAFTTIAAAGKNATTLHRSVSYTHLDVYKRQGKY